GPHGSLGGGGGDRHGWLAAAKLCRDEWVFWCSSPSAGSSRACGSARRGGLKVRRMGIQGHPQGYVVLERGLQRAEQEGEAGGGVECLPDLGVSVSGEPCLGDLQVGRVVPVRDKLQLDRGPMPGLITL